MNIKPYILQFTCRECRRGYASYFIPSYNLTKVNSSEA
jgi:hypothetical protein